MRTDKGEAGYDWMAGGAVGLISLLRKKGTDVFDVGLTT